MTNTEISGLEVFQLRSRVLRAVYYDVAKKKMIVETTRGKIRIYRDIGEGLVSLLVNDPAPGMVYERHLKAALKPLLCSMTMSNIVLSRRVRQISRTAGKHESVLSTQ